MPIARRQQTLLLLDASATETQTGIWRDGQWLTFQRFSGETLDTLFRGVSCCLEDTRIAFSDVDGFIFCEGPGSVLGIRLAAITLQGWKSLPSYKAAPILVYRSLPTMARLLQIEENPKTPFHCIAEGGRGLWNLHTQTENEKNPCTEMKTVASEAIENLSEPVFHIPLGRQKQVPPENAEGRFYHIEGIANLLSNEEIFRMEETPQVLRIDNTNYVKWSAQRHR